MKFNGNERKGKGIKPTKQNKKEGKRKEKGRENAIS